MTHAVDVRRRERSAVRQPPTDGTEFCGVWIQPYRWRAYSPKSDQFRRGLKGRWQCMNEYRGWENAAHPPIAHVQNPDELEAALNAYREGKR